MVEKLDCLVMDKEIDEEIFMKSPVGMEEIDPGRRLLPTSERHIWFMPGSKTVLEKVCGYSKKEPFGFQLSPADPSILFKENELGVCIIIMYVDDMLIIGQKEQIQEFATRIQQDFSVKI